MYNKGWVIILAVGLCAMAQKTQAQTENTGSGSPNDDDARCLEQCLDQLQQRAPSLDAASVLSIGHIRTGNTTVVCPKYNAQMINTTCGPYRDATSCLDKCPNGALKTLSTSGFAPLQLVCVDRRNDFDQYMPCITENCPSVELMCQPKCGSFDDISNDIMNLISQIRGSASPADQANVRIDPTNVTMIIDKACQGIECYADCSRNATTTKCGKEAYNLEMETVWTIFASMTQSMSSIGLTTPWPESCKTLSARSATWSKSAVTTKPNDTPAPDQAVTRNNSVDQFIQKQRNDQVNLTTTVKPNGTAPATTASSFVLFTCTISTVLLLK